ncbi:hypothetical protein HK101_006044 [Irineochytrium annulatum]|nr:hypothetical protein HK101_006044 [Irineochytrium annulatum]
MPTRNALDELMDDIFNIDSLDRPPYQPPIAGRQSSQKRKRDDDPPPAEPPQSQVDDETDDEVTPLTALTVPARFPNLFAHATPSNITPHRASLLEPESDDSGMVETARPTPPQLLTTGASTSTVRLQSTNTIRSNKKPAPVLYEPEDVGAIAASERSPQVQPPLGLFKPRVDVRVESEPEEQSGEQQKMLERLLLNAATNLDLTTPPEHRIDSPKAMTVQLLEHQKLGVEWMSVLNMLFEPSERGCNRGGILADDMGLGKTMQTIALMLLNPSPKADDYQHNCDKYDAQATTLIVAPTSLIYQWQEEIATRVGRDKRDKLKVLVYHGKEKSKAKDFRYYAVVITTYGTLLTEYPRLPKKKRGRKNKNGAEDTDEPEADAAYIEKNKGPLLKTRWWRVVLDEVVPYLLWVD